MKLMVLIANRKILNGDVVGAGRQVQNHRRRVSIGPMSVTCTSERSQSFSAAMLNTPANNDAVALSALTKSLGKAFSGDFF